jgi:hypothetical protein
MREARSELGPPVPPSGSAIGMKSLVARPRRRDPPCTYRARLVSARCHFTASLCPVPQTYGILSLHDHRSARRDTSSVLAPAPPYVDSERANNSHSRAHTLTSPRQHIHHARLHCPRLRPSARRRRRRAQRHGAPEAEAGLQEKAHLRDVAPLLRRGHPMLQRRAAMHPGAVGRQRHLPVPGQAAGVRLRELRGLCRRARPRVRAVREPALLVRGLYLRRRPLGRPAETLLARAAGRRLQPGRALCGSPGQAIRAVHILQGQRVCMRRGRLSRLRPPLHPQVQKKMLEEGKRQREKVRSQVVGNTSCLRMRALLISSGRVPARPQASLSLAGQ